MYIMFRIELEMVKNGNHLRITPISLNCHVNDIAELWDITLTSLDNPFHDGWTLVAF